MTATSGTSFWKHTSARYSWPSIALHWLMLVLIVAVYAAMDLKSIFPKGSPGREAMATWHYMLGLSVFFLVWVRALMRLAGAPPAVTPTMPAWQSLAARAVQWAMYALMIGLPVLGWLTLSAKGTPVPFFGLELPALIAENKAQAKWLKDIHETGATVGYFLVGLHAIAALFHHYIQRDNTLRLMLPRQAEKP
jgi:cytochrome b561